MQGSSQKGSQVSDLFLPGTYQFTVSQEVGFTPVPKDLSSTSRSEGVGTLLVFWGIHPPIERGKTGDFRKPVWLVGRVGGEILEREFGSLVG